MRLTEEQKKARRSIVGSSDIAAIVGCSPHGDAFAVWNEKMGIGDEDDSDNDAYWFGHELEPLIARRYEQKTGHKVIPGGTFISQRYPFAAATIDYAVVGERIALECKNVGTFMLHGWDTSAEDGLPHDKIIQVQWQMLVRDYPLAHVAALLGGTTFRIFEIPADAGIQSDLVARAEEFYRQHMMTKIPPTITESKSVRAWLDATYPRHTTEYTEIFAGGEHEEIAALMRDRAQAAKIEKEAAAQKSKADHILMASLKEGQGYLYSEKGLKFTWRANKNGSRRPLFQDKSAKLAGETGGEE